MKRTLANAMRPTTFSGMIGQEKLVESIRRQYNSGREPSGWLFVGQTGNGKTTIARILAVSLQCEHQEIFGDPCQECIKNYSSFSIQEINASEVSGVNDIEKIAKLSVYKPMGSRRSVFLLDEAQRISKDAQNLLLKYVEDAPDTTVWIICTTEENKLLQTIVRRFQRRKLRLLQELDIKKLVLRAFKFTATDIRKFSSEKIIDKILETQIQSSGLVLNAVENYLTGMSAKDAVESVGFGADTLAICRSLEKGDWDVIRKEIKEATNDDLRGIRAQVSGYLRRALEKAIPGPRANEFARAIKKVATVDSFTDATSGPATVAALYELCQIFAGPQEDEEEMRRHDDD